MQEEGICEVQLFELGTRYTIKFHYIDPHPLASVILYSHIMRSLRLTIQNRKFVFSRINSELLALILHRIYLLSISSM